MARVLITGGSGLIGGALTRALLAEGHTVHWLGRTSRSVPNVQVFTWDPANGTVDPRAFDRIDAIVHLSGAGIADRRWTRARKQTLFTSRVEAAHLLHRSAMAAGAEVRTFVSAAGIGYYGAVTRKHIFTESDPPAADFIGTLSATWEQAAKLWSGTCRVAMLRTPTVLARDGGALPKLAAPVRLGLGAPLGRGDQWVPWVHIDDLVRAYVQAITDERLAGAYNVVAPEAISSRTLMRTIAQVLHRPFFLPAVPGFLLRMALGEMGSVVLEGSRATSRKLLGTGFRFRHAELRPALEDLLQ